MTQEEQRKALTSVLRMLDGRLQISGIQNIETINECAALLARVIQSMTPVDQ